MYSQSHTHIQIDTERRKHNGTVIQQWEITSIECFSKKDDGITIKINKQDNLLINDHLRASSTSTSASKALMLTMQQVCAASPLFYFINIRCWCVCLYVYLYLSTFWARVALAIILESLHILLRHTAKSLSFISHFLFIFSLFCVVITSLYIISVWIFFLFLFVSFF